MKRIVLLFLVLCLGAAWAEAQQLPSRKSVLKAMNRANDYFIRQHPDPTKPTFVKKERPSNLWTRGVYFEGLSALNRLSPQQKNIDYMNRWAAFHRFTPRNGVYTRDADDYCCCQAYLEMLEDSLRLHQNMALSEFLYMARPTIDCMNNLLQPVSEQMTPQTKARYGTDSTHDWTWIDAIQMGLPVLTKLGTLCEQLGAMPGAAPMQDYANHGYRMYLWTRDSLAGGLFNQQEGLWWRDKDFVSPYKEPNGQNCYWCRGNGWVYAALVRAMEHLEPYGCNALYQADFLQMTIALVKCQRPDHFWNVSLHDDSNFGGKELTGTALFVYGMAWGVRKGILPRETFLPIVAETWRAMVKECLHKDGFLGFVQGTGKEPKDSQPVTYDSQPDFDDFGLGCFLLAGSEVYQLCK